MSSIHSIREWLAREADRQRREALKSLDTRKKYLEGANPVELVRDGLSDICPKDVPAEVLEYLGITDQQQHFSVSEDCGNRGHRLQVTQGQREWDSVRDPWESDK